MKRPVRRHRSLNRRQLKSTRRKKLGFESLEDRRMLASVTVGNSLDVVNAPDTSSIAALLANDGGDGISLREAIVAANNTTGADTIDFASAVFNGVSDNSLIRLNSSLQITDTLTIDATTATDVVITGDATNDDTLVANTFITDVFSSPSGSLNNNVRVINATAGAGLTLRGLTITGGTAPGSDNGGGILFNGNGTLTLEQSTISGNTVNGGDGGGIFSNGAVVLNDSAVSLNSTYNGLTTTSSGGGGIATFSASVTLINSTVSGNSTRASATLTVGGGISTQAGDITLINSSVNDNSVFGVLVSSDGMTVIGSGGGGIHTASGDVTITNSTVSGNTNSIGSSASPYGGGGGIDSGFGSLTITNSTVSGNATDGNGGGILADSGTVTITNSTISGNQSGESGGGIFVDDVVTLIQNSTITDNFSDGVAGGIGTDGTLGFFDELVIVNSIVAGNNDGGTAPDLFLQSLAGFSLDYSLIGDNTGAAITESQIADADGNLIGSAAGGGVIHPLLSPLADNGGPTLTHALLPTSPAINAGDPEFDPGAFTPSLDFDQRGGGFDRVLFGQIDIGAFESPAFLPPQGLIVSTTADVVDDDFSIGNLSLREAIATANASAGTDTITFDPAVFGDAGENVIRLSDSLGELEITETLTIDATGLGVVISGDTAGNDAQTSGITDLNATPDADLVDNVRVVNFTADSGDLTLRGLAISGGRATGFGEDGGGIRFGGAGLSGTLTLDESTVAGNSATGSFAEGGGIGSFSGNVTLINSTISGNQSSDDGGGVFSYSGDLTIVGSTISGNRTTGSFGDGGGAGTITGNIAVFTSTISGNATNNNGGGIHTNSGDVGLFNSTITENQSGGDGGGLFVIGSFGDPSLTLSSTIIAGNTASGVAPDLQFDLDGIVDIDFSLIGETADSSVTTATGSNNLLDVDPLLGLLADNGGPTQTHALLVGSPAIDAGTGFFGSDQRGFERNVGGNVDIGAFERQLIESTTFVVSTISDVDDGILETGELSLREAIRLANEIDGDDTITFEPVLFGNQQTIALTSQLPILTDDVTIAGPGADLLTLDAGDGADGVFATGDGFQIFSIESDVTLSGLTLTGGDMAGSGGAIANQGGLTLNESAVLGNAATDGGGISNGGVLQVVNSTFAENFASNSGGGINNVGPNQTTVIGSTFSANTAVDGGGIANEDLGTLEILNATIFGNSASKNGAGVFNLGTATLSNTIVAGSLSGAELVGSFAGSFNLIADGSGGLSSNDNLLNVDPLLGSLADNGGPTQTHALLAASPAINGGDSNFDPAAISVDQRGLPRLALSAIDIGAFELQETDLVVSTTADLVDGNFAAGELSLREAISIANQRANADTIVFAPAIFNGEAGDVIRLSDSLGELQITESLTIDATGLGLIISGDTAGNDTLIDGVTNLTATPDANLVDNVRVLNFVGASGDLTLRGLTITGGRNADGEVGGGIRFGGFDFTGTLAIEQSVVSGNQSSVDGGGIGAISGNVKLTSSTVSDNQSLGGGGGGGISTPLGDINIVDSTISGNQSLSAGGAIATSSGAVTLINSTISGNSTSGSLANGGGIVSVSGAVTVISSTVTDNQSSAEGGGIFVFNTSENPLLTIENSIVAGNTAVDAAPDLQFDTEGIVEINFSLIGDTADSGIVAETGTGNLLNVDEQLGPLADNGGLTQTHALFIGSPAIDAANPNFDASAIPLDQRGLPRVALGSADIGAFELQEINLVVSTTDDVNDGDTGSGELSLREAIAIANDLAGEDVITFDPTVFTGGTASLIRLNGSALQITESVIIDGLTGVDVVITGDTNGNDTLTFGTLITDVDASLSNDPTTLDDNSQVLNFSADAGDLTLHGLTITGGRADAGGGVSFGTFGGGDLLTINQSTISGNVGRGISTFSGDVVLSNSVVRGNEGSGIYAFTGDVMLSQSTVSQNRASTGDGGGIATASGDVTLVESTVSGNNISRVGGQGGGIATNSGDIAITRSSVTGNSNTGDGGQGGGLFTNSGNVTITDSTISGNSTTGDLFVFGDGESYVPAGGGIATFSGNVTSNNSTISGNGATGEESDGGGIFTFSGQVQLFNSTVTGNVSNTVGGGVFISSSSGPTLTINNSIIAGNTDNGTAPDLRPAPFSPRVINNSLIGVADNLGTIDGVGNLTGTSANPLDPLLGPLANNGGPTQTHALLAGSPAIDAGDPNAVAGLNGLSLFDQRGIGFDRIVDDRIDIGAFESGTVLPPPQIIDVIVGGSGFDAGFVDAIDGGGAAAGNGLGISLLGSEQLQTLPFAGIDTLFLQFSSDVSDSLTNGDVLLTGTNGGSYQLGPIEFDSETNIATIPVIGGIDTDALVLTIFDGAVSDASGNALDGEFSSEQTGPSGDGVAGGRFDFFFNVLIGDEDASGQVTSVDAINVFASNAASTDETNFRRDIDGNGVINSADAIATFANNGNGLPDPPTPPTPFAGSNGFRQNSTERLPLGRNLQLTFDKVPAENLLSFAPITVSAARFTAGEPAVPAVQPIVVAANANGPEKERDGGRRRQKRETITQEPKKSLDSDRLLQKNERPNRSVELTSKRSIRNEDRDNFFQDFDEQVEEVFVGALTKIF